jgi:hypothetical protein
MNVSYHHQLESLSNEISGAVTMLGSFLTDNSTIGNGQASMGIYQFTDTALGIRKYVVKGESLFLSLARQSVLNKTPTFQDVIVPPT